MSKAEAIASIAASALGLETLETRNRDQLDFHEHSVASIRDALDQAFEAGRKQGGNEPGGAALLFAVVSARALLHGAMLMLGADSIEEVASIRAGLLLLRHKPESKPECDQALPLVEAVIDALEAGLTRGSLS